ncbi:hypothetical protein BH23CHL5_BH23CHL5_04600 [soil metagenome]
MQHGEPWHLLAVGLPLEFDPPIAGEDGPTLARRAVDAGAFLAIAHPSWYSLSLDDAMSIDSAHAVETYNHTAHHHNDRGESWAIYEQLLMKGKRLHAIATDDAHLKTRPDYFGGWVMVRCESLDPESLVTALKQGHSYSTQGPEIHNVVVNGSELRISTSPARAYYLSGGGSSSQSQRGDRLVNGAFDLAPFTGRYCRVTVVDEWGRRAWTNAIWVP